MASRPHRSSRELGHWEYLVEPLESELRKLGGVGISTAAVTATYHRRLHEEEKSARYEKILLEELTKLRGPLQRATEYVNEMMDELQLHSSKRRRTTENLASSLSSFNVYNAHACSRDAAVTTGEDAADGHHMGAVEDPWKGARELFSKVVHVCTCRRDAISCYRYSPGF